MFKHKNVSMVAHGNDQDRRIISSIDFKFFKRHMFLRVNIMDITGNQVLAMGEKRADEHISPIPLPDINADHLEWDVEYLFEVVAKYDFGKPFSLYHKSFKMTRESGIYPMPPLTESLHVFTVDPLIVFT